MEAMLLGGGDDSSDESESGKKEQPPAAVAAPAPPTAGAGGSSDYKERLKSLYSPAQQQHRARQQQQQTQAAQQQQVQQQQQRQQAPPMAQPPPPQQQQRPPPQRTIPPPQQQVQRHSSSSQQQQQQHAMQQRQSSGMSGAPPPPRDHRQYPHGAPGSNRGGGANKPPSLDPYAPTPVSKMQQQHRSSSYNHPSASGGGGGRSSGGMGPPPPGYRQSSSMMSSSSSASSSTVPTSNTRMPAGRGGGGGGAPSSREAQLKKQKEHFLLFTRVLIKYLEQKDPGLHSKVKSIIKDCAERNKRHEPGYESVTASMKMRLKQVVNEQYWQRAESYLQQLLHNKGKQAQMQRGGGGSSGSGSQQSGASSQRSMSSSGHNKPPSQQQPPHSRQQQQQQQQQQQPPPSRGGRMPQQQAPQPGVSRTVSAVRKDIAADRARLQAQQSKAQQRAAPPAASQRPYSAAAGGASGASTSSKGTSKSKRSTSKASQQQQQHAAAMQPPQQQPRKTSLSTASSSAVAASAATTKQAPEPKIPPAVVNEYKEFMKTVDHAINLQDWQTTPLVLGHKTHALISQEQRQLLYHAPSKTTTTAEDDAKKLDDLSFPRPGWSRQNIVSARNGWSKVRLREKKLYGHAGPMLPVPNPSGNPADPPKAIHVTSWFNEQVAEEDAVLAALSEGAQLYLQSILEKAVYCARQRQNVDGIRLWHSHVVSAANNNTNSKSKDKDDKTKKDAPPLTLRLGCDVSRQVARTAANAALVNQRMEEALARQTDVPSRKRVLDQDTLEDASSMSEIALLPRLGRAVDHAEVQAARDNEIAGGKHASEPPLGRIPKQARLEVVDFQNGMQLAMRPGRHRASVVSGAFSF